MPRPRQVRGHLLGVFAADAVNDRGLAAMPPQRLGHLRIDIHFRKHPVEQIGAIERADQHCRVFEPELLDDVAAHALGGGRGVGVKARALETCLQLRQLAIFRPEVVPPVADAMGLVDREASRRAFARPAPENAA